MREVHASVVFNVLAEELGARESQRDDFMHYLTRDVSMGHEFRFGGDLGFGGKLYWDGRNAPRVGYYRENATPELDRKVEGVNFHLKALFADAGYGSAQEADSK